MGKLTFGHRATLSSRNHLHPLQLKTPTLRFGYQTWAEVIVLGDTGAVAR